MLLNLTSTKQIPLLIHHIIVFPLFYNYKFSDGLHFLKKGVEMLYCRSVAHPEVWVKGSGSPKKYVGSLISHYCLIALLCGYIQSKKTYKNVLKFD